MSAEALRKPRKARMRMFEEGKDIDPLEDPKSKEEMAAEARAAAFTKNLLLRDECQFILTSMPYFMAMLKTGLTNAERVEQQAVDDLKPYVEVQRHNGAKRAIRDLISDIEKHAKFKIPEKKAVRRPPYE